MSKEKQKRLRDIVEKQPTIDPNTLISQTKEFQQPVKPEDVWKKWDMGELMKGKKRADVVPLLSKAVASVTQKWGVDKVIADVKYRGVRGIFIIDPKVKTIKVLSRKFKADEYQKFAQKFRDQMISDLNADFILGDPIILDSEIWGKIENQFAPQGDITGLARAPEHHTNITPMVEVFDIYMLDGHDLRNLPLSIRKEIMDETISERDAVLRDAATKYIPNTEDAIRAEFQTTLEEGHEGVVIKNPTEIVRAGKYGHWLKLKGSDTVDLELKGASKYPTGDDKAFQRYQHWQMVPSDSETNIVQADKGQTGSNLDHSFFAEFTKKAIDLWKKGEADPFLITKRSGRWVITPARMVPVDPKYVKLYGVSEVPEGLTFPKGKRDVVEIYSEDISLDSKTNLYSFPGLKIVGTRDDKKEGDTIEDIKTVRNTFYQKGVEPTLETKKVEPKKEKKPKELISPSQIAEVPLQMLPQGGVLTEYSPKVSFIRVQGTQISPNAIFIRKKEGT